MKFKAAVHRDRFDIVNALVNALAKVRAERRVRSAPVHPRLWVSKSQPGPSWPLASSQLRRDPRSESRFSRAELERVELRSAVFERRRPCELLGLAGFLPRWCVVQDWPCCHHQDSWERTCLTNMWDHGSLLVMLCGQRKAPGRCAVLARTAPWGLCLWVHAACTTSWPTACGVQARSCSDTPAHRTRA